MPSLSEILKSQACHQSDCPVRESGKCLEGLEPENCSHFYWTDATNDSEVAASPDMGSNQKFPLFSGQDMAIEELTSITYRWPSNIIIIIGESDAGKTTLLSSIFDLFQFGKFSELYFAGSQTCIGFEIKCHKSRETSNANVPETDKTNTEAFRFLHLAIKRSGELKRPATQLLLSDIGGERFREAASSSSYMRELEIMKYATHFTFLIDGGRLADKYQRTATIANAQTFIRRAIDVGNFNENTNLQVVLSKADEIHGDNSFNFEQLICNPFRQRFNTQLASLSFLEIAARPKKHLKNYEFGYGLEPLLNSWVKGREYPGESAPFSEVASGRWFQRYSISNG